MTSIERHPVLDSLLPDATSTGRRPHRSPPTTRPRSNNHIPPAAPSPPSARTNRSPPRKVQITSHLQPGSDMASDSSHQWLFTDAELADTPSIRHGLSISEERCRRAKGVNFITQVGILLKLPQLTLATASVFFHRFYMRHSMVPERQGIHHYNTAATAIFLATKTEENCRKTKEIVISVAKVAQKNASLIIDEQSKEYWRWRDNILSYEELMLEMLTFDLAVKSPYNYLYDFIRELQIEDNKPLRNAAWAFLNDSCITVMCLLLTAKDTAIASLYFAARYTGETIPEREDGSAWWENLGADPTKIAKAIAVMSEFYKENPLKRNENPLEQSPAAFGNEVDLDQTRPSARSQPQTQSPEAAAPSPQHSLGAANTPSARNGTEALGTSHQSKLPPPAPSPPTQDAEAAFDTSEETVLGDNTSNSNAVLDATTMAASISNLSANGSSDRALKAAADDPSTHESTGQVDPTRSSHASLSHAVPTTLSARIPQPPPSTSSHSRPPPITPHQELHPNSDPTSQDSVDLVQCPSDSPRTKRRKESPKRKVVAHEWGDTAGVRTAKRVKREEGDGEESEEGELEE